MKIISKTRMIDFLLKCSSNFSKKQLNIQSDTDFRDNHLIN